MVTRAEALDALRGVEDPELPVSIVDLGMVRDVDVEAAGRPVVTLVPTFLGCPAQLFIEQAVQEAIPGAEVRWSTAEWDLTHVNDVARAQLRSFGIALPDGDGSLRCPHCASSAIVVESEWGSTLCRKLAYCCDCRSPVEVMKGPAAPTVVSLGRARTHS